MKKIKHEDGKGKIKNRKNNGTNMRRKKQNKHTCALRARAKFRGQGFCLPVRSLE